MIRLAPSRRFFLALLGAVVTVPGDTVQGQTVSIVDEQDVLVSDAETDAPYVEPHLAVDVRDPTHLVAA